MATVSTSLVDSEINRYGSTISMVAKTTAYTEWGDESCSTTTTTTVAVHNDISGDEDFNTAGIYRPGDKIFFFKSDASLTEGNEIIFGSKYYRITEIITHHLEDQDYVSEVRCKKVL